MTKLDVFINKNASAQSAQYTVSRYKEITRLLEKNIFKVVTTEDIPSNVQIFNSHFVEEMKNQDTDKLYEKCWLVV